jgi:DNA repair protein RecO (recombination protein O)
MKQTDKGIFLHRTAFSDSSLIVTYYTAQSGLRKFVFKGGKKKAHQLFPLAPTELTFYGRPESDLLQLTNADPNYATDFQFDPVRSTIAFFVAEVIRKSVHEYDTDTAMYAFLHKKVLELQRATAKKGQFPLQFLVDFTELLGMQPLLTKDNRFFDLDEGSFTGHAPVGHRVESGEHVQLIAQLITGEAQQASREVRDKALQAMMEYYRIHLPGIKGFDTYSIVREVLS